MANKCRISSPTKEGLQNAINRFFYSSAWVITDDNRAYNSKLNEYLDGFIIKHVKGRWQLRQIEQ